MRKCLLMGFAVFFKPGTLMQLILVILVVVAYIAVLAYFRPYSGWRDDFLAVVNQFMLFTTLVTCVIHFLICCAYEPC